MTFRYMIGGLFGAFIVCIPSFTTAFSMPWPWAYGFFFALMGNGLECFVTFFHEIGHSLAGWFYGMPTIPMFDFAHGGGWAWVPMGQVIPVLLIVWCVLLYGIFVLFRDDLIMRITLALLLVFNIGTAFNTTHNSIFDVMGPWFEPLTGGFFLIRALRNLAPRGRAERFLNSLFGFAMPFHSLLTGWGLLHNAELRQAYWTQKDGQGSGDFDKIADRLPFGDFNDIVGVWIALSMLCLIIPFIIYLWCKRQETLYGEE